MPDPEQLAKMIVTTRWLKEKHGDKNFVQRLLNATAYPTLVEGDGHFATHKMASSDNYVFPLVVQHPETGKLGEFKDWHDAYDHAMKTGEYIQFPDEDSATHFGKNYKKLLGWE